MGLSRAGVVVLTAGALAGAAGCGDGEALGPVVACPPAGPATPPTLGFPGEPGVLSLPTTPPSGPFKEAPHRGVPPVAVQSPRVLQSPKLVTVAAADDPLA